MCYTKTNGFTLIEIAVVLLIVGVVAGGVTTGKSLIRAAELRGIIEEVEDFRSAMFSFEAKYRGKAGDLRNATLFWGALNTNNTTCQSIAATGMETCNGNGDGRILVHEGFRMWQHLSNAGLWAGHYSGVAGPEGVNDAVAGQNIPISAFDDTTYMMQYSDGFFLWFNTVKGNILFTGSTDTSGDNQPWRPYLTAQELSNMDIKIDDGHAVKGSIIGQKAFVGPNGGYGCTTSNDEATAEYNTNKEGKICAFYALLLN